MTNKKNIKNGTRRTIKGRPCVYYDGHWIRHYDYHSGKLADKKRIIDKLTRRVFHHVEPGINTPGQSLAEIRAIYELETDAAKKRIKGAMLAGALLNRGRDILTHIVELQEVGVSIETDNELLNMCGNCFSEALDLGKNIKLASGKEGLDELWGEPFKAFSMSPSEYYDSRYIKLAQTMSHIDEISKTMIEICKTYSFLATAKNLINELATASKRACETLRSDPVIFEIWPAYIAAKEALDEYNPKVPNIRDVQVKVIHRLALNLIKEGAGLVEELAVVRVPMPTSKRDYLDRCKIVLRENL